jgi:outer membrane protein assembly factor BamE
MIGGLGRACQPAGGRAEHGASRYNPAISALESAFMRRLGVCFLLFCSGCSVTSLVPQPHRVEIQQGNVLTQEMVGRLSVGMTTAQVRFLLGSPPVVDPFHPGRWDYVYLVRRGGKVEEARTLTLFFEDDRLVRVAGDVAPLAPEEQGGAEARPPAKLGEIVLEKADPAAPPPPPEEKGFFGRLLERVGL